MIPLTEFHIEERDIEDKLHMIIYIERSPHNANVYDFAGHIYLKKKLQFEPVLTVSDQAQKKEYGNDKSVVAFVRGELYTGDTFAEKRGNIIPRTHSNEKTAIWIDELYNVYTFTKVDEEHNFLRGTAKLLLKEVIELLKKRVKPDTMVFVHASGGGTRALEGNFDRKKMRCNLYHPFYFYRKISFREFNNFITWIMKAKISDLTF